MCHVTLKDYGVEVRIGGNSVTYCKPHDLQALFERLQAANDLWTRRLLVPHLANQVAPFTGLSATSGVGPPLTAGAGATGQ